MENKNSSATVVMVGFLIIGILIGIFFFVYLRSKEKANKITITPPDKSYHSISINNNSDMLYTVILPSGEHMDIKPKDSVLVSLSIGDFINASAYNYDGTVIKYSYKLISPKITHLFIGNTGIHSNISSGGVNFINASKYPVMLIEKSSKGGKRWGSNIIPLGYELQDIFVSSGSIWQVVHPTDENNPISELNIGYIPKKLLFDGKNLKAI